MDDLVNRLRQVDRGFPTILSTAADRIEQLERELAEADSCHNTALSLCNFGTEQISRLSGELAVEKALSDRFSAFLGKILVGAPFAEEAEAIESAYRKARGL